QARRTDLARDLPRGSERGLRSHEDGRGRPLGHRLPELEARGAATGRAAGGRVCAEPAPSSSQPPATWTNPDEGVEQVGGFPGLESHASDAWAEGSPGGAAIPAPCPLVTVG